jgi:hypothetical protein
MESTETPNIDDTSALDDMMDAKVSEMQLEEKLNFEENAIDDDQDDSVIEESDGSDGSEEEENDTTDGIVPNIGKEDSVVKVPLVDTRSTPDIVIENQAIETLDAVEQKKSNLF